MQFAAGALAQPSVPFSAMYWDIRNGNEKGVAMRVHDYNATHSGHSYVAHGNVATITPGHCGSGPGLHPCPWSVEANYSSGSVSMTVDFSVDGMDEDPPSTPLVGTYWSIMNRRQRADILEFTDSSRRGHHDTTPLRHWVAQDVLTQNFTRHYCPVELDAVFADMVDGDMKRITIGNSSMTIQPCGSSEWAVNTELDEHCRAVVDFKASGKPASPPVNLMMTHFIKVNFNHPPSAGGRTGNVFQFTDPSETLASDTFPLNHWVQLEWDVTKTCGEAFVVAV